MRSCVPPRYGLGPLFFSACAAACMHSSASLASLGSHSSPPHPDSTNRQPSERAKKKMRGPLPDAALRCPSSMPANPRRPAGHPLQSVRSGGSMTPYPSHRPPMLQRPQQPASPISACAFSGPPHADMGTDQNVRRRLVETSKALPCNAINRSSPKGDPAGGDAQTQKKGVCLTSSFPSARAQFRLSAPTLPSWRERARSRSLRHRDMAPPQRELAIGSDDG